jgi:transposase InsO family protein
VPWKAKRPVDMKMEFVARLKRGERMSDLCLEYGIHRQTGYEVWQRYKDGGVEGLLPQSRAPKHIPHKTPKNLVDVVVQARKEHPTWGAKKLKVMLEKRYETKLPAHSTICAMLKQAGLIEPNRKRRVGVARPTGLTEALAPNDVWCADYKGQFRLGDQKYCYPLTLTDQHSRFLLACQGMERISDEAACEVSTDAFRKYGIPAVLRTDNGVPFASKGLAGLTRLSAFWMRLGIRLERIQRGHPEQNGRHERMHRTLKAETTRPAAKNALQQQERFSEFQQHFNHERPHEAIGQKRPGDLYVPSTRAFSGQLPPVDYPMHDDVLLVRGKGVIQIGYGRRFYLSEALTNHPVGLRELADGRWLITFMDLDLGVVDRQTKAFVPTASPLEAP